MAGKHFSSSSQPYKKSAHARSDARQAANKPVYDDRYSYEEPRTAKRGTQQSTAAPGSKAKKKKSGPVPTVLAVLFLLAALGIMTYIVWDLGLLSMISALLG